MNWFKSNKQTQILFAHYRGESIVIPENFWSRLCESKLQFEFIDVLNENSSMGLTTFMVKNKLPILEHYKYKTKQFKDYDVFMDTIYIIYFA